MAIFNGKIHYKWWFSIAMLVHQRVIIIVPIKMQFWGCVSPVQTHRIIFWWFMPYHIPHTNPHYSIRIYNYIQILSPDHELLWFLIGTMMIEPRNNNMCIIHNWLIINIYIYIILYIYLYSSRQSHINVPKKTRSPIVPSWKISGISQLSQRVFSPWKVFHYRYALSMIHRCDEFLTIISQLLIHYHDINRFTIIFLIHHDLFTLHYQCFTSIQIVVNNYQYMFHHYFFIISYSPWNSPYIYLTLSIFTHERSRGFSAPPNRWSRWLFRQETHRSSQLRQLRSLFLTPDFRIRMAYI